MNFLMNFGGWYNDSRPESLLLRPAQQNLLSFLLIEQFSFNGHHYQHDFLVMLCSPLKWTLTMSFLDIEQSITYRQVHPYFSVMSSFFRTQPYSQLHLNMFLYLSIMCEKEMQWCHKISWYYSITWKLAIHPQFCVHIISIGGLWQFKESYCLTHE